MDSNMKKLCSKCGSELDVSHAFCGVCGQKVVIDGEGTSDDSFQYNTDNEAFPLALPVGSILAGQYTIDKVLGQGGFGITYKATDYRTNEKVAIKEFFPDTLAYRENTAVTSYPGERTENYEYGKETFLQEAQTLAQFIGCENIVRIHSYFEENGTAYFVMDYIEGKSFDNYIKEKGGKISYEEAKNILVPVMDALNIVHSKGIVHRDVTPDNIYITNDGVVKLLDFGAARYSLGDKSRSLDVILKHGFAPKEQYTSRGKQGPFTDIYSLGASFYFALTGKRPLDSIERLEDDNLVPPSTLGVAITAYQEDAILKAISVQPAERYSSMLDFKNALLAEPGAKPQPMPTSNVVQHYFTAPMQQTANIENINMSQNQTADEASSQQESTSKKKSKKRLIIAIASVAGILLVLSIIMAIAVPSILKSVSGGSSGGILDIFDKKEYTLIGNSSSNIINGGFITEDGYYWIGNSGKTIYDYNRGYIVGHSENVRNLLRDGEELYYLCGNKAYVYSESQQGLIKELEKYDDIQYLFISKDYYFIYEFNDYEYNGCYFTLYRVSRENGEEEESISVGYDIGFIGDKFFYNKYNSDKKLNQVIMMSASDFSNSSIGMEFVNDYTSGTYIADMVASDKYIYTIMRDTVSGSIIIQKRSGDLSEVIQEYDTGNASSFGEIVYTNAIDNQMSVGMGTYKTDLFHVVTADADCTVDYIAGPDDVGPTGQVCIVIDGDKYLFHYLCSNGDIRCRTYNANGELYN